MPPELLGPWGLTIGLGLAVALLWRDHLRADADDRAQRDQATSGWREADASVKRLAEAIEKDTADRTARRRSADA